MITAMKLKQEKSLSFGQALFLFSFSLFSFVINQLNFLSIP